MMDKTMKPILTPEAEERLKEPAPPEIEAFLTESYQLSAAKIDEYRENGFVQLDQVISAEPLRYYRELIAFAVGHVFRDDDRALGEKSVYQQSFLQAFNLRTKYPAIQRLVHCPRLAHLARQLMELDGVRLWFDQALFKQPGGRLTDYHQDAGFWPVSPPEKTTTIWIALVDVPRERGCMSFAGGSHRLSSVTEFVDIFGAEEEMKVAENIKQYEWIWVPLASGDCTFHSGLTYPRAAANETEEMREAMTIAYMAHDVVYDWHDSNPRADRHKAETEGIKRGGRLNNPLTPRLV